MDVMMPEMDGMEACENIRKIPELRNVIIALTARSEDYRKWQV
jgi:two-component system alkaline phosphatase synthesis response regulator PhoP